MCNWTRQLNVAHTFAAHFCQGNFNATLFADNAAVLHALVLAAQTLVILDWAKNLGAKKTFTLRLERSVVNGLWLLNFAKGP